MANQDDSKDALEMLLHIHRIKELQLRYCRGIDRLDEELVRSAFHPDSTAEYGNFKGNGWDFAKQVIPRLRKSYKATMHYVTNHRIEVRGESAFSETYLLACHRLEREDADYDEIVGGRYVDRLEFRDGEWKIVHRVLVHDWSRTDPVGEIWSAAHAFVQGRRDEDDLTYQHGAGEVAE
jgi:hypothetical protein